VPGRAEIVTPPQLAGRVTVVAVAEPKLQVTPRAVTEPVRAWAGTAGSHTAIAAATIMAMMKLRRVVHASFVRIKVPSFY
jgi:hypothetical protein